MSIKSQEGHMRQLALLLTTDLGCIFGERESGPNGSKKAFLNVGKVFLRALAKDLGLHEVRDLSEAVLAAIKSKRTGCENFIFDFPKRWFSDS